MELEVAMIYAKALFEASTEQDIVSEVRDEIVTIDSIFEKEPAFNEIMANPAIPAREKKQMLTNIFGEEIHESVMNFFRILVDKGRFYGFHNMVREYCRLDDDAKRIGDGEITSAMPLSEAQIAKFEDECGKLLQKKIALRNVVDPDLIGGVKIFVEGKIIDASFASKLEKMAHTIRNS